MPHPPSAPDPVLMQQAIDLAVANVASGRGGPFGALVARQGEIVATGVNLVTATNDPTAHAEVTAIRRAAAELGSFTLAGCDLYTSCEPCPMCLAASYWARLDRIVFGCTAADAALAGFDDANFYSEIGLPHGERAMPMRQLLREQARASFSAWHTATEKIKY